MNFGGALLAAGLALGSYSLAQLPGTSLPPGLRSTGAAACTPNDQGGGSDGSVVGLWHLDNNGTDQGIYSHSISSLGGAAAYSNVQSKFGGYSLKITTGGSDYANVPAGINLGTGELTYEMWMYQAGGTTTYTGVLGDNLTTTGAVANPAVGLTLGGTTVNVTPTWSAMFGANAWHHAAWVRRTGNFYFYYDGVQQAGSGVAAAGAAGNGTTAWTLGRAYSATYVMPSNSYLDEVRISNVARYTANFTPQVLAFCNPVQPTPSSSYRYWRLDITAGTSGPARIAEWTMNVSGTNQIPAMTANTTSGVTISSAGTQGSGFEEWRAANRNGSSDFWYSGPQPATWIKVDLGSAKHIDTYTIQAELNAIGPAGWTLKGSNDDSFYFNIDTQSGQTWTAGQIRTYTPPTYP